MRRDKEPEKGKEGVKGKVVGAAGQVVGAAGQLVSKLKQMAPF